MDSLGSGPGLHEVDYANAQENIEPSLRIQTQRRVAALEADLAAAEKRDVEKKNGAKYHAVSWPAFQASETRQRGVD